MAPELAFDGVLFPSLLPVFLISALVFWPLETLLTKVGVYRWFWHPSLARLSFFILLFAGFALARTVVGV